MLVFFLVEEWSDVENLKIIISRKKKEKRKNILERKIKYIRHI